MGHLSLWVIVAAKWLPCVFFVACKSTTSNNAVRVIRSMTLDQYQTHTHNANLWLCKLLYVEWFPPCHLTLSQSTITNRPSATQTAHQRICWASSRDRLKSLARLPRSATWLKHMLKLCNVQRSWTILNHLIQRFKWDFKQLQTFQTCSNRSHNWFLSVSAPQPRVVFQLQTPLDQVEASKGKITTVEMELFIIIRTWTNTFNIQHHTTINSVKLIKRTTTNKI